MSVSTLRIGPAGPLAGQASASDGSESAASILRSALLTHYGSTSSSSTDTCTIAIDNKYFTASVALADLDLSGAAAGGEDAKEDGVLLVFHDAVAGQAAPLDALASVHSAAEASNQAGNLLRLLVAVGPVPDKATKAAEEEYSRRVLWCLDRGYEYVEADCSESGVKAGHDEREKDGFARVVEAVSGTVWSCAVNKPREQRGAAAALAKIEAELQEGEKKQEGGPSEPDTSDNKGGADTRSTGEAKAEPTAADAFPMPPEPKASEVAGDSGDKGGEDQFFFENLDSVMAQVRSISSQARSGALTDEERRMKASDAAVALMGMLENMGFEDESSSAGGEHSSQED